MNPDGTSELNSDRVPKIERHVAPLTVAFSALDPSHTHLLVEDGNHNHGYSLSEDIRWRDRLQAEYHNAAGVKNEQPMSPDELRKFTQAALAYAQARAAIQTEMAANARRSMVEPVEFYPPKAPDAPKPKPTPDEERKAYRIKIGLDLPTEVEPTDVIALHRIRSWPTF